jgi:hypothetical protein
VQAQYAEPTHQPKKIRNRAIFHVNTLAEWSLKFHTLPEDGKTAGSLRCWFFAPWPAVMRDSP